MAKKDAQLLYQQIYQYLLDRIQDGTLKVGDRIGSELELAEQFGVSRITSKRALDKLAQQNLIVRHPGRGTYVVDPNTSKSEPGPDRLIGVIMPEIAESYGLRLFLSIEETLSEQGYSIVLKLSRGEQSLESDAIRTLSVIGVKGMIIFPVNGEYYSEEILRLSLNRMPLVVVDKTLSNAAVSSVSSDNGSAAKLATDYLFDLGHRNIGFLSPEVDQTDTLEARVKGYTQAHIARGLAVNPSRIFDELPSDLPIAPHSGFTDVDKRQIQTFLMNHPEMTAVVAGEYATGLLLHEALLDMGRSCPEDLSIVVFDGPSVYSGWQFTRILQDESGMGQQATKILIDQINGIYDVTKLQLPTSLVEGNSTRVHMVSQERVP